MNNDVILEIKGLKKVFSENLEQPVEVLKNIRDDDIPRYSINRKSRYAIEIPAFSAKKYGIKIGYKVNIQN